jgi:RNA recognition motif-containing protein
VTKDKKELSKIYNNIYVKNFPAAYSEDDIKNIFSQYGEISSLYMLKNENGATAFICFGKEGADRNYGFDCA